MAVGSYGKKPKGRGGGYGRGPLEVPRAAATGAPRRPAANALLEPDNSLRPARFRIQGRRASDLEWMVYQALLRLGWTDAEIDFQTDVLGGRRPGGAVLDFVVWTHSGPVIVEPDGDHWHASLQQQQEDQEREAMIAAVWDGPFFYHRLRQAEMQSLEQVVRVLERWVGRG